MAQNAEVYIKENKLSLVGNLDFANAMSIYQASLPIFTCKQKEIFIDFAGLLTSNSVIMGMIINWMRFAEQKQKQLILQNISSEIQSLLAASRLSKFIQANTLIQE